MGEMRRESTVVCTPGDMKFLFSPKKVVQYGFHFVRRKRSLLY